MADEIASLSAGPLGDVCIAVLDGPVDVSHPCFAGADLRVIDTLVPSAPGPGPMSLHGTHVASMIFGRPGSPVSGVAPRSRGLILPVFRDAGGPLSQVELARAIEIAVREGTDVINISGGERAPTGEPDDVLAAALRLCETNGVLVVAAVGNDGCDCVQVPAAVPSVLAVGACTVDGQPLATNDWGAPYRVNGVLAPGYELEGARPGGGTAALSGSSFAAPIVSGAAALLIAAVRGADSNLSPAAIRDAVLHTASACDPELGANCERYLGGLLNLPAAHKAVSGNVVPHVDRNEDPMETMDTVPPSALAQESEPEPSGGVMAACADSPAPAGQQPACGCATTTPNYVFAIGTIGWDFGTEARRDAFIQQMDTKPGQGGHDVPANPYNPMELARYLRENPWVSDKVIWTCNLEGRTPIYALEAEIPFGMDWGGMRPPKKDPGPEEVPYFPPVSVIHKTFRQAIVGQTLRPDDPLYVARVSIPGTLTNRTVRLFSGQVIPVVVVHAHGLYTWNEAILVNSLIEQISTDREARNLPHIDEIMVRSLVHAFLDKVYYQFRNLGQSGPDRALNYAATNAFELTQALANGFLSGRLVPRSSDDPETLYALDDITVVKSRYQRPDSESYDVTLTFMDPENDRQSRVAYLITIDVSGEMPVSLHSPRQFLIGR
ncbi:S8 family serine peptidase [Streptomyces sp. NPDC005799]|uniref:S8 family serine peptidase n=1 Tax=Streptomyces sp. NPDC005799 TaxID=3154678 RepID=UPI0033E2C098